ncbi:MAG TPA: glycosyltransferase 87 family protein [Patescibacteria group bacterium]|nr:glycosyltransferase 87 family protein [Patescibacteria group bacterium]
MTTGSMAAMSSSGVGRRRRRLNLALVAIGALGLFLGVAWLATNIPSELLVDVRAYYDAGARLNAGEPLYAQTVSTNESAFYRYPPLLAIAFRPLALLPFPVAAAIWEAVVVASLVGLLLLIRPGVRGWSLAGMLALPIAWSVVIGQAQVPVTFLMAIGSPGALALATHLKVLPALAAIWWIGRRDWNALGRFAAWSVGLAVLQLILEPTGSLAFPSVFNLGTVGEVINWSPYAISPTLWAALLVVGTIAAWRLAPTRWGWAAAVTLSVLATPRLILYQLMTLLAAARQPR